MADRVQLPKDPDLAGKIIAAQTQERGMLGHFFGTKEHAPTNIAGFLLIACVLGLGAVALIAPEQVRENARDIVTGILSLITLIVGFIFGRKTSDE